MSHLLGSVGVPTEDGHWLPEKVHQIVELIEEYDPNIKVEWIPPGQRAFDDPVFRLIERAPNRQPYVMFYVQSIEDFDERVLARVISADNAKNGTRLSAIEAHNDAVKLAKAKQEADEAEERADLAMAILNSPKARYRHNGVTYE